MSNPTFILDNGGWNLKAGLSSESAKIMPNSIMKAKSERRRAFICNQIDECRDVSSLYFLLPFQKGFLVNWDVQKTIWDYLFSTECFSINLNQTSVIITEPPFNFPLIQEGMIEIFFEEYEVESLLKINPSTLSCYHYRHDNTASKCCIVVDIGYSFCHIIPYVNDMKIKSGIRRIDIGGKLLTNHLKDVLSYRQLNVMDETFVVNQVKEDSCFISQNFLADMEMTRQSLENNNIVKDYVLPDFATVKRGYLTKAGTNTDQQILRMNNERFTIPEIIFHPSDIGINQMGIAEAIIDSLKSCKKDTWPHLLSNIVLTGGSSQFIGMRKRIMNEVQSLASPEYSINIFLPENPITYAWEGGRLLSKDPGYSNLIVKKQEYEEEGQALCFDKFDT